MNTEYINKDKAYRIYRENIFKIKIYNDNVQ